MKTAFTLLVSVLFLLTACQDSGAGVTLPAPPPPPAPTRVDTAPSPPAPDVQAVEPLPVERQQARPTTVAARELAPSAIPAEETPPTLTVGLCNRDTLVETQAMCAAQLQALTVDYGVATSGEWRLIDAQVLRLALSDVGAGFGPERMTAVFAGLTIYRDDAFDPARWNGLGHPGAQAVTHPSGDRLEVYDLAFYFGADGARFTIIHELAHVYDYRLGRVPQLAFQAATARHPVQTKPGVFSQYEPRAKDVFSAYQYASLDEDFAETFAGLYFRGQWSRLTTDGSNIDHQFSTTSARAGIMRTIVAETAGG